MGSETAKQMRAQRAGTPGANRAARNGYGAIRLVVVLILGLGIAAAAATAAGEPEEEASSGRRSAGFYLTPLVGGSWATGSAQTTTTAGANVVGSGSDRSAFGGAAAGTILDLGFSDLRLELEGTGGRSFTFATPGAPGFFLSSVDVWTLQGNFWFEYPLDRLFPDTPVLRDVAPFGGGGLGLSRVTLTTTDGVDFGRAEGSELAWQAGGGLAYRLRPWLVLEARYQYADLGSADAPLVSGSGPAGTMEIDLGTHEVIGGIRFVRPGR